MAIIEYMKNPNLKRARRGLAACALIAGTPAVLADNVSWTAGDGAWESPANWSGGAVPTAADFVDISHSGAVSATAIDNVAREILNKSVFSLSAGKLAVDGTFDTFGALKVTGGAALDAGRITVETTGALNLADSGSAISVVQGVFNYGNWQMANNATLTAESFDNFASLSIESGARATANSMINHGSTELSVYGARQRARDSRKSDQ